MTFETWWDSTGRALFHGIGGRSLASSAFAAGAASLTADLAVAREALGEAEKRRGEEEDRRVRHVRQLLAVLADVSPPCAHCKAKKATCVGAYEDQHDFAPACDDCCGHGNEDGRCVELAAPLALDEAKALGRDYLASLEATCAHVDALTAQVREARLALENVRRICSVPPVPANTPAHLVPDYRRILAAIERLVVAKSDGHRGPCDEACLASHREAIERLAASTGTATQAGEEKP